jgi:hypothetical protein
MMLALRLLGTSGNDCAVAAGAVDSTDFPCFTSVAASYSQQDSFVTHTNSSTAALCCCTLLLPPSGAVYSKKENWADFAPMGFNGIFRGASVVFFAYLVSRLQATPSALHKMWIKVVCMHCMLCMLQHTTQPPALLCRDGFHCFWSESWKLRCSSCAIDLAWRALILPL